MLIQVSFDKIAPFKTEWVKGNTQKGFDRDVLEKSNFRNKVLRDSSNRDCILIKNFISIKMWCVKTDWVKKQAVFKKKLSETIGNPMELWESLKFQGMPNIKVIYNFNVIEDSNNLTNDTCSISKILKNFFQTWLSFQNLLTIYNH